MVAFSCITQREDIRTMPIRTASSTTKYILRFVDMNLSLGRRGHKTSDPKPGLHGVGAVDYQPQIKEDTRP